MADEIYEAEKKVRIGATHAEQWFTNATVRLANDATIYAYKMTHDDGDAPCTDGSFLTLAICQPKIRMKAKEGSF